MQVRITEQPKLVDVYAQEVPADHSICPDCRKRHTSGRWGHRVYLNEEPYLLGRLVRCCGKRVAVVVFFPNEESAEKEVPYTKQKLADIKHNHVVLVHLVYHIAHQVH